MTEQQFRALLDAVNASSDLIRREVATISHRLDSLTEAVLRLTDQQGERLSRADVCQRLNIHRNTLSKRLTADRKFPRPGPDGKWSVSELLSWELSNVVGG